MATDTQGTQEKFSSDYDDQDDQSSNQYDQQSNFDNIKQEESDDTYNDQQQDSNCGSAIDSPKYIRLRGLPWSATHQEILDFLKDVNVVNGSDGIHLITSRWDGKNTGEAYVEVQCQQDVDEALKLNKASMGHRYIEVFTASPKEAKEAMRKTGSHGGSYVVKLRGLPYSVTEQQVEQFFHGLEIKPDREGILFIMDRRGRSTGEAFVQFESQEDTERALGRNRAKIGHRYIEIFRSSLAELKRAANGNVRPGPYDLKGRGSNRGGNNDFGGGRNNMRGGGNGGGNWGNNNGGNNNGGGGGGGGFGMGIKNSLGGFNLNNNSPFTNSGNFGNGYGPNNGNGGNFGGNVGNNNGGFGGNNRFNNSNGNFGNDFGDFGNFGNNRNFNNGNNNNNDFGNNRGGMGGGGGNLGSGGGNGFGNFGNFNNFGGNNMGGNMGNGMGGGNGNNMGGNGFNGNNNMGGNFGPIGGGRGGDCSSYIIHMRGLPYSSYENDVFKFFDPIKPANVRINFNNTGLHSGTADAYFDTYEDAQLAMKRHRQQMGSRYIELFFDGKTKGGNSKMGGGNNGGGNFSRRI